jgi:diguanylate cyclase
MASSVSELMGGNSSAAPTKKPAMTELERANRALRTLSAGNHTLLHAIDEQELLHAMCRVIVEKGGYHSASVAYAQHDAEKSIRWMAYVGNETGFLESLHYTWADTELGGSATGTAIRTGKPSIGRNLLTDPTYDDPAFARLRDDAIRRGYAATTALPLYVDGKVLGSLSLAAKEPDAFDDAEVKLLAELAADLAYGIDNLRTRIKHRQAQQLIAQLAYYDPMTGLPNRTLLLERMDEALLDARRQHHALALLHIKVGVFNELNKVFGYRAGDQLLKELSQRLAGVINKNETLARVGETGFALLLPRSDADYAIQVAHRLMVTLHDPVEIAAVMVDARAGIGIALYPGHGTNAEALLRRAKTATSYAGITACGFSLYTGGQEEINTRRLALMADLRRAIDDNALLLYFQPKVDMLSGQLCGSEALVRWLHPQHGMISTIEFVRIAEQSGLITPLTNWVLDAAFSQVYDWHESGMHYPLAINLSAYDLRNPDFIDRIGGLFSTWGISPELIQFELTESAMMEDPAGSLETLRRLKSLGTKLFIDDFGTGYSSLSYLQKLPMDAVKIDQSFVAPMTTSDASAVIVRSAIDLSHNLDLAVVAEGVESQATWNNLAHLGCDVAQGYLMSRALPADQFSAWSKQWAAASH